MTIFGTEFQALTIPLHCHVNLAAGDVVRLAGISYRVVSETKTASDEHGTVRVVTVRKIPQSWAASPLFTA